MCESGQRRAFAVRPLVEAAEGLWGLNAVEWAKVHDEITQRWSEHGPLLSIQTAGARSFRAILSEARDLLAKLSLAARLERPDP
jgi:hypothetical protein